MLVLFDHLIKKGPIVFIHFYSPGTSVPYNHTGHPTAFAPTTRICMDFYGLEWTLNEFLKRCVFKGTRQNKKTPEILSGARSMEQVKGISGRQERLPAPLSRSSILDCRFRGGF